MEIEIIYTYLNYFAEIVVDETPADQEFSVNFGYSDSFWKYKNDAHFAKARGCKKLPKPYADLSDESDKN